MAADSASPTATRHVDAVALAHIARRLARVTQAPWLHAEVARRMAERLPVVRRKPQAVADWWSFDGGGAQALQQTYPDAHLFRVASPAQQLAASGATGQAPWWSPRRWASAAPRMVGEAGVPDAAAQLLWANMMLHLAADPAAVLRQWHRVLDVDGFLMFSTFGPGSLAGLRALYGRLGWPAPHAPFVDMHDLGDLLVDTGFADPVMDQEMLTLTWADAGGLLAELRVLGGNASALRTAGLRTPRWQRQLQQALQALAGADGRLRLDFEIVYGHAFKGAPRPRVSARTSVALQDMRAMVRSGRGPGEGPQGLS